MTTTTDVSAPTFTGVELNLDQYAATRANLDKINARAAKRGLTGRLNLVAEKKIITETNDAGFEIERVVYICRIEGIAPAQPNWRFVATLDFDGHAGLIVRTVPGVESVDRTGLEMGKCAHCQRDANRVKGFLLYNTETGAYIQVGSTCIKDFLGWTGGFAWLDPQKQSEFAGGSDISQIDYTPLTVLAISWAVIQRYGFVPRSARSGAPTSEMVLNVLYPRKGAAGFSDRKLAEELAPYAEAAKDKAREVLEFIASDDFKGESEYVRNLKSVAAGERVTPRYFGLLVSAPNAWARHNEQELIRRANAEANAASNYVGKIKERLTLTLVVESVRYFDSDWGVRTLVMFRDQETGNIFKTWASNTNADQYEGKGPVTVRGTVKAHEEYQGVKATLLTRVVYSG